MGIKLNGLRQVFRKFLQSGTTVKGRRWHIEVGATKEYWQLSYNYMPVLDSVKYKLFNVNLDKDEFRKVCDVIISEAAA